MCFPAGVFIAPIVEGYVKFLRFSEANPLRTVNELKEGITTGDYENSIGYATQSYGDLHLESSRMCSKQIFNVLNMTVFIYPH